MLALITSPDEHAKKVAESSGKVWTQSTGKVLASMTLPEEQTQMTESHIGKVLPSITAPKEQTRRKRQFDHPTRIRVLTSRGGQKLYTQSTGRVTSPLTTPEEQTEKTKSPISKKSQKIWTKDSGKVLASITSPDGEVQKVESLSWMVKEIAGQVDYKRAAAGGAYV